MRTRAGRPVRAIIQTGWEEPVAMMSTVRFPVLRYVLQTAARAISGVDINLRIINNKLNTDNLAETDGVNIYVSREGVEKALGVGHVIDRKDMNDIEREALLRVRFHVRALHYHELAHCMYTPIRHEYETDNSAVTQMLTILEEGRIESLFVVGRSAISKVFEVNYYRLCFTQVPDLPPMEIDDLVLHYGREYLADHDSYFAERPMSYAAIEHRDRLVELVREFNRLSHPKQEKRAIAIATELVRMRRNSPNRKPMSGLMPAHAEAKLVAGKKLPDIDKAEKQGEANLKAAIKKAVIDGKELKSAGDIVDVMMQDEEIKEMIEKDIDDIKKELRGGFSPGLTGKVPQVNRWKNATPKMIQEDAILQRQLRRLVVDIEPEIQRRRDSGKIDIGRLLLTDAVEGLYNEQVDGAEDNVPVDIFVLLDSSGSMAPIPPGATSSMVEQAAQGLWHVQRAVQAIPGSRFAATTYNTQPALLVKQGTRAGMSFPVPVATGGTNIMPTLVSDAIPTLLSSPLPNRILIVISDGEWIDKPGVDREVMALRSRGVACALFCIGYSSPSTAFDLNVRVDHGDGFVKPVIGIVTKSLRKMHQEMMMNR